DDGLLRVQLDDQLLLDGQLDVVAFRQLDDGPGEALRREVEPSRHAARPGRFHRGLDLLVRAALLLDRDDVALAERVRRDRDLPAVHGAVAVPDELPGLGPRGRESERVHDVVETPLELLEEVRAGDALAPLRPGEGQPELTLEKAVDPLDLLLLPELNAVA